MLQQEQLCAVIDELAPSVRIEIETAGTLVPTAEFTKRVDAFNVSPKLAHSGNDKLKRYRPEALDALKATGKVQAWKFVAQSPSDLQEVDELVKLHGLWPVYIMPEGVTREDLEAHSKDLIDAVIARGWHMTPRLHIQLWGNERGH
jgi:organic radical activating enzyme